MIIVQRATLKCSKERYQTANWLAVVVVEGGMCRLFVLVVAAMRVGDRTPMVPSVVYWIFRLNSELYGHCISL
jgi:hypothetical protein